MCENCIRGEELTLWTIAPWNRPLFQAYTGENATEQVKEWQQSWQIKSNSEVLAELVVVVIILLVIRHGGVLYSYW